MEYSLKKGLNKGLISLIAISGAFIAFSGFSEMTLWGMLEMYLKPILGSLTIGGSITILMNYLKVKSS